MDEIILIDESNVTSHRSGVQRSFYANGVEDDVCYVWCVMSLDFSPEWPENKEDIEELHTSIVQTAERVSGGDFGYYYGGPGRLFCDVAGVRIVGKRALVTQRRGWDV